MRLFAVLCLGLLFLQASDLFAKDEDAQGGWLGVRFEDIPKSENADGRSFPGVRIAMPELGGPADAAGIKPGDVIVLFDNEVVDNLSQLIDDIYSKPPGAKVDITIRRGESQRRVAVVLGDAGWGQPIYALQDPSIHGRSPDSAWRGEEFEDLTREEADALGWEAPRGAKVVYQPPGGLAEIAGLSPGDTIVSLDGFEIENARHFLTLLAQKPADTSKIALAIRRDGREKRLVVNLSGRSRILASLETNPQVPLPLLDAGGHVGQVRAIAYTPDGKQFVSASTDKTIRVWDAETGKTLRVIRGEAALGDWGQIYAMALSPDGRWLAVGGYLHGKDRVIASSIRLYDFASGRLETRLEGHDNLVDALAFSPDGKRLISGGYDGKAIVWDFAARKRTLQLKANDQTIRVAAFTNDGQRIITGGDDETLRLWSAADGSLIAEMTEHKHAIAREVEKKRREAKERGWKFDDIDVWPAYITSLAVAPNGAIIASGSDDGRILLWDARTGAFLRQLAYPGGWRGDAEIFSVAFSPDSRLLLSTNIMGGCMINEIASGASLGNRPHEDYVRCNGGTAFSPDGRFGAAGSKSRIQLLDAKTGKLIRSLDGSGGPAYAVGFSQDGRSIAWGDHRARDQYPDGDYRYLLRQRLRLPTGDAPLGGIEKIRVPRGGRAAAELSTYIRGASRHGSISARFRPVGNGLLNYRYVEVLKEGQRQTEIDLGPGGQGYGGPINVLPDGNAVVIGTNRHIRAYDSNGHLNGSFIGHDGAVRDLLLSPDGQILLSGSMDQTVRLWNRQTQELLVTLFATRNKEWVMWTPQGYYAATGPGAELIGWQINRGADREPDYVTAAQLRKSLNRPDIVARAIQLASAEQAVREAHGTNVKLTDLLARPLPQLSILSPQIGAEIDDGKAELTVALEGTSDPVKLIRVQVNGRQIAEHIPEQRGFAPGLLKFTVPLAEGRNAVRLTAVNQIGEVSAEVVVTNHGRGELDRRGTLYILAIGVDRYPKIPGNDLRYSGADAELFAKVMESQVGVMHERVVKRVLINVKPSTPSFGKPLVSSGSVSDTSAPTAANIMNALGLLAEAQETDTVMVFVAGHGVNEGHNYRFLPTDAIMQPDGRLLPSSIVPWYAFQEAIETAKGRRVLFLDTCHSGNSYNQRLTNDSYQANIIVYSAARWDQLALERADLGHGIFTYAATEGIKGKAATDEGQVTTLSLRDFLVSRVSELAKGLGHAQEPQYFRGRDATDYLLIYNLRVGTPETR